MPRDPAVPAPALEEALGTTLLVHFARMRSPGCAAVDASSAIPQGHARVKDTSPSWHGLRAVRVPIRVPSETRVYSSPACWAGEQSSTSFEMSCCSLRQLVLWAAQRVVSQTSRLSERAKNDRREQNFHHPSALHKLFCARPGQREPSLRIARGLADKLCRARPSPAACTSERAVMYDVNGRQEASERIVWTREDAAGRAPSAAGLSPPPSVAG
ncbi:hypothetical protein LX32DRAFT_709144 [Colletotrichum zoysiae]|uniref:Uncharacterized protein n=1 Tax=Colletotrichum zoysiae TaxID=1216348 RepID=A0AAD9H5V4_9PEZI|nr:hypothetical protein LX32DRAFT_709144 [Colletotrichum zoysiae]